MEPGAVEVGCVGGEAELNDFEPGVLGRGDEGAVKVGVGVNGPAREVGEEGAVLVVPL